jgi:hypothetical protein
MKRASPIVSIIGAAAVGVGTASAVLPAEPEGPPDLRPRSESVRGPHAATADPHGRRPWVVRTYTTEGGLECPELGRSEGGVFGREDPDKTFVPLPVEGAGACVDPSDSSFALAVREIPQDDDREGLTILYGMVLDVDARPVLEAAGSRRLPLAVEAGTFVFATAGQELVGASFIVQADGRPHERVRLREMP